MAHALNIENADQLLAYLREQEHIGRDENVTISPLVGGVSNRTVWVQRASGEAWVLKQALAKLRVAVDWFSSPERIHREAAGTRALAALLPAGAVPRLIFEDRRHHVLAMEAVPQPHDNWKTLLFRKAPNAAHVRQFAQMLGAIHSGSRAQKERLAAQFSDRSFFESLRLEPYYLYTATRHPEAERFYTELVDETRRQRLALTHGDYSPKNILVHQERLVLLDHEVIHWGDPAFDIGFSLTHLLSKAHHVSAHRQAFVDAAHLYWQTYAQTAELLRQAAFEERAVRHTLGCLLARVDGRSPLEYLSDRERQIQRTLVLALMAQPPSTIPHLIRSVHEGIEAHARD